MHPTLHLLAPLLVLLPAAKAVEPPAQEAEQAGSVTIRLVVAEGPISRPTSPSILPLRSMADGTAVDLPQQVPIQQQVTIRVAPRPAPMPPMLFDQTGESDDRRYHERK